MFEAIFRLFRGNEPQFSMQDPRLAVAALLVHLAAVDGEVNPAERAVIKRALKDHYGVDETDVPPLLAEAGRRDAEAVDFYGFTSAISRLPETDRVEIIRIMWQVVYADHTNSEFEDNMVWRIAELIGVSSRRRTALRKQMASSAARAVKDHQF